MIGAPLPPTHQMSLFGHSQCRLHCPTEQAKCQPQNPALVAACLFPLSSGQSGWDCGLQVPCAHPWVLMSHDAAGTRLSAPAGLGLSAVCECWEEVQGESGGASHGGNVVPGQLFPATSTLRTAIHGAPGMGSQCLCQTFRAPSTQPLPQPAFLVQPPALPAALPLQPSPIPLHSRLQSLQGPLLGLPCCCVCPAPTACQAPH